MGWDTGCKALFISVQDKETATMATSKKFRSVLPHEPLPVGDSSGYLHLQGALEPKKAKSNTFEGFYWSSSEALQAALEDAFCKRFEELKLPFSCQQIELLDRAPPFTKFRLIYSSPKQALEVLSAIRVLKSSPKALFPDTKVNFGAHALQATMITSCPLPENSWTRSNPPKFRRLLHDHLDSDERKTTRFVHLCGLLMENGPPPPPQHILQSYMRQSLEKYDSSGLGLEIFLNKKSLQACHIGFRSPTDAQHFVSVMQGQPSISWLKDIQSGNLFVDYATVTQKSRKQKGQEPGEPSRPECTSRTAHVEIPGLVVLEDFVTEAQEATVMATLTGPHAPFAPDQLNKSQTGNVKRQVQHYGYVFDYQTADVLRDRKTNKGNCPPMPALDTTDTNDLEQDAQQGKGWHVLAGVVEKTRNYEFEGKKTYPDINQLTVNHYKPGQGIGSHVDTPSAFGDGLISISLGSGIVMEFTQVGNKEETKRKLVYLPRRSLVLMSGPARYNWEHFIVTRRTDTVNGTVLSRGLRVSLTLRTALTLDGKPMPLVFSRVFPPTWGSLSNGKKNEFATPQTERDHVHAVYDAIATQWHHTRGKRGVLWPGATLFLQRLPKGSVVADVGCGDGKYFPAVWEAGSYVIGTDISRALLETTLTASQQQNVPDTRKVSDQRLSLQDRPAVAVADCMAVPLRDKSVDAAICIAVMHHLSTEERRKRCIQELIRIVQPGGMINIQAWAIEQERNSKRRFAAPDVFVPFNAQPKYLEKVDLKNISTDESKSVAELYSENYIDADFDERKGLVVFRRYCHMYRQGELEELCESIERCKLIESGYESGNHFVILQVTE